MRINLKPAQTFTKRTFLSLLARVFDPLGWVAPVTVIAKCLMQLLWLRKVGWDETLPPDLNNRCLDYQTHLAELSEIAIPRWTGQQNSSPRVEIHGFSDASNLAYAAVVYLRVESVDGSVQTSMLYSKTRVAPLKVQSIPRLELCAAALLSHAIVFVQNSMHLREAKVVCWSDSMVTLAWLRSTPSRWSTFVANRVSAIISLLPSAIWRHVPSGDNPADSASRGLPARELNRHSLWWSGPTWLRQDESLWPKRDEHSDTAIELRRKVHACTAELLRTWSLPEEISSWTKLLRVTAYIRRFISNSRKKSDKITGRCLTAAEVAGAREFWVKTVQSRHFRVEILELQKPGIIKSNKSLATLNPFLDANGILRLGGRLRWARLDYAGKYPAIIPKCRVSELIVSHSHLRTLHGGLQATLRSLRQGYWLFGARNLVKRHIRNCVVCVRHRAETGKQLMGDLPKERVTPARPFTNTGVDYAGPFHIRTAQGRGRQTHKAYLVVFICLATRAIHLEAADDYTSDGFLAAFDRFSARRGLPAVLYSDNGTNFVGADRELSRRIRELQNDTELRNHFASDEIEWRFIPPAAPHFGGLWEAGVKSAKFHLRRILGDFTPTFAEFTTLLCKIEGILNSRPIAPLRDDPEEFDALTPGHFLVGSNLKAVPNVSVLDVRENRLSRWQTVQKMYERFWKVWSADYLNTLQQRSKWRTARENMKVGDLVLVRNPNLPPTKWELGRVEVCHTGEDGLVRVVTVRTSRTTLKRPITQLCKLPVQDTQNA